MIVGNLGSLRHRRYSTVAPEKRHDTVPVEMYPMIPRVQIDFGFTKSAGGACVDDDFGTSIIAVDHDTGLAVSFVTGTKECDAYVVRRLAEFVDRLHQAGRVELWSDTESAPIAIITRIIAA